MWILHKSLEKRLGNSQILLGKQQETWSGAHDHPVSTPPLLPLALLWCHTSTWITPVWEGKVQSASLTTKGSYMELNTFMGFPSRMSIQIFYSAKVKDISYKSVLHSSFCIGIFTVTQHKNLKFRLKYFTY